MDLDPAHVLQFLNSLALIGLSITRNSIQTVLSRS